MHAPKVIGFTGTRQGMTAAQLETVARLVRSLQPNHSKAGLFTQYAIRGSAGDTRRSYGRVATCSKTEPFFGY
jgi:hypothetical protein